MRCEVALHGWRIHDDESPKLLGEIRPRRFLSFREADISSTRPLLAAAVAAAVGAARSAEAQGTRRRLPLRRRAHIHLNAQYVTALSTFRQALILRLLGSIAALRLPPLYADISILPMALRPMKRAWAPAAYFLR